MNRWVVSGVLIALAVVSLLLRHAGKISDTASSTALFVLLLVALASNFALMRRDKS